MSKPTAKKAIRVAGATTVGGMAGIWLARLLFGVWIGIFSIGIFDARVNNNTGYLVSLGIAVLLWLLFEWWHFYRWSGSLWLIDREPGFTVKSLFGSIDYEDEDVDASSLSFKTLQPLVYAAPSEQRRYILWVGSRKMVMESFLRGDKPDELGPVIERLEEKLYERAKATIADGGKLEGDHWDLDATTFRWHGPLGTLEYPVDSIVAAANIQGNLLLWEEGENRPLFTLPHGSRNFVLLYRLIAERLAEREAAKTGKPEPPAEAPEEERLGRFLYESHHHKTLFYIVGGIALALCACAPFFAPKEPLPFIALILFFSSMYLVPSGLLKLLPRAALYENGFQRIGMRGRQTCFYSDVTSYTLDQMVQYYNGIYAITSRSLKINLRGAPGKDGKPGKVSVTFRRIDRSADDREIGLLSESLLATTYQKMELEFQTKGTVRWNDEIRITNDGLEITPKTLFGKPQSSFFVPFTDLRVDFDVIHGVQLGWTGAPPRHAIKDALLVPEAQAALGLKPGTLLIPANTPNYFPAVAFLMNTVKNWVERQEKSEATASANEVVDGG